MNTINYLFFPPLLIGVIFIFAALLMYLFPPKSINSLYGYRTSSSMKSKERWDFAQKYSTAELFKMGGILILLSTTGFVYQPSEKVVPFLGIGLAVVTAILLIVRVEKAIKKRFGEN